MSQQLEKVQEALKAIHAKEEASDAAVKTIQSTVQETHEGVKAALGSWAETMRQHCEETCKEAEASASASCTNVSVVLCLIHPSFIYMTRLRKRSKH